MRKEDEESLLKAAGQKMEIPEPNFAPSTAPEILEEMAHTFRGRNEVYGSNYKDVGAIMEAMYPNGLNIKTPEEWNKHLVLMHIINKVTRFIQSKHTHQDSIHDIGVYAAILEELILEER